MILGHFGLALAAKRIAPRTSLGTTTLAAQLVDLAWPILLLAGLEHVRIVPGLMPASVFDFTDYPWTHSLVLGVVWGLLLGGGYFLVRRSLRGALVVGALVPSHWALDFLVHRPDLPLWPGGMKVGLGAWSSLPLTIGLELLVFGAGVAVYLRATRASDRTGSIGLWAYLVALVGLYASVLFGPPPSSVTGMASGALAMWLLVPWAAFIDRHREPRARR